MAEIVGLNTTFTSPNYYGDLFLRSPSDHRFLSAIGGFTGRDVRGGSDVGVEVVNSVEFTWNVTDLRTPSQRARLEGADAPQATARSTTKGSNVLQIVQETVATSYTRRSVSVGVGSANGRAAQGVDEHSRQVQIALVQAARDLNYSFLRGVYHNPTSNTEARTTRGLLEAIETNRLDAAGAALTDELLGDLLQQVWTSGGITEEESRTLIVGAVQKRALSAALKASGFQETQREMMGVNVTTVETDFGLLNVMLEREMPNDTAVVASLEQIRPVALNVVTDGGEEQGILFVEPLAKTGAQSKDQLYGEWGLNVGNELAHGIITGLRTGAPVA